MNKIRKAFLVIKNSSHDAVSHIINGKKKKSVIFLTCYLLQSNMWPCHMNSCDLTDQLIASDPLQLHMWIWQHPTVWWDVKFKIAIEVSKSLLSIFRTKSLKTSNQMLWCFTNSGNHILSSTANLIKLSWFGFKSNLCICTTRNSEFIIVVFCFCFFKPT